MNFFFVQIHVRNFKNFVYEVSYKKELPYEDNKGENPAKVKKYIP